MSVLVKGMEMPESCYECPMVHREFDGYETRLDCYIVKDWCPEDEEFILIVLLSHSPTITAGLVIWMR